MEIKTLEGTNDELILEAFNNAFSDYFIPFHLKLVQLQSKMKADNVQLDVSVGVFEADQLIAFVLHGMETANNQKHIYNGGTGVIPLKRGSGLTKKMHEFILPKLREQQVDLLKLEVITNNVPAIKSYEKVGYQLERELTCYKGTVLTNETKNTIVLKELTQYDWPIMESFWDFAPTWQNSKRTVNELMPFNKSIGAFLEGRLVGYVIHNTAGKRIHQIAVHPQFRRKKIATTLVTSLTSEFGNELSIINIEKKSVPVNAFFKAIGLENNLNQFEMKMQLSDIIQNK